jgi:diguanylate cyclase (GGDEF)-like protein
LWANGAALPPVFYPRPDGITMRAIRERQPIVIQDASTHPLYTSPEAIDWGVKAIASFPLLRANSVVGAFNVAFLQPHTFSDDEMQILTLLADQAALAVDNARLHEALADQAKRDSLTQVYNHGHLLTQLACAVEAARTAGSPLSFIMLDIDTFKQYNDRHGHVTGDIVLKATVQAISSNVKQTDTVGRWGGEEFGIVLPGANASQARRVAERIRATVARLELVNSKNAKIANPTVSQGIASFPEHATTAEDLVDLADQALYRAKGRGRDQVMVAPLPVPGGEEP